MHLIKYTEQGRLQYAKAIDQTKEGGKVTGVLIEKASGQQTTITPRQIIGGIHGFDIELWEGIQSQYRLIIQQAKTLTEYHKEINRVNPEYFKPSEP